MQWISEICYNCCVTAKTLTMMKITEHNNKSPTHFEMFPVHGYMGTGVTCQVLLE